MLRTDDRALLVDLLTPPDSGFRLERAVGTTFTMQLESLLRIPLAVVGSEWRDEIDPLGVMQAVRRSADRIDAFCQAGMLRVPSNTNPLLAFLEPMVHQVTRPAAGRLFHPKVWLASFTDDEAERRFRLLCGSRNLTGDRAWDAVVALDGAESGAAQEVNEPLAEFVASLPGRVPGGMAPERAGGIRQLADAVRLAAWEPPDGVSGPGWLRFHWLERGRPVRDFAGATRTLMISPFLGVDGIARAWSEGAGTIVSRSESFAALGPDYVEQLVDEWNAELYELDDSAALPDEDDEDTDVRWSLRGLHAKVIIQERGRNAHVLVGSANLTDAAWDGNTEFMVEVVGPARRLGVSAVFADVDGGFRQVLRPVDPRELPPPPGDPTLQDQLDRALVDVAAMAFTAVASEGSDGWNQVVTTSAVVPGSFPGDAALGVRLLTGDLTRVAEPGAPISLEWTGLADGAVTPYVVVELRAGTVRSSCVVLAELHGGPVDRIDRLIAEQVGDPEAFIRFLMLLLQLANGDETAISSLIVGQRRESTAGWFGGSGGVLEAVVVALAEHPRSLDDVGLLVERLSATEEGRRVLPVDWDDLWAAVTAARTEVGGGS